MKIERFIREYDKRFGSFPPLALVAAKTNEDNQTVKRKIDGLVKRKIIIKKGTHYSVNREKKRFDFLIKSAVSFFTIGAIAISIYYSSIWFDRFVKNIFAAGFLSTVLVLFGTIGPIAAGRYMRYPGIVYVVAVVVVISSIGSTVVGQYMQDTRSISAESASEIIQDVGKRIRKYESKELDEKSSRDKCKKYSKKWWFHDWQIRVVEKKITALYIEKKKATKKIISSPPLPIDKFWLYIIPAIIFDIIAVFGSRMLFRN